MESSKKLSASQWRAVAESLAADRERWVRFARRRAPADVDAEEIVHHALLRALAQLETLEDPSRATPWFFQILRRSVTDALRARSKFMPDDGPEETPAADRSDATSELSASCECVNKLMRALRPEYATVLSQVVLEGASLREAAVSLNTTENNAAVRLHRARAALRREIQGCCGVTSYRACLDCMCDIDGTCAKRA